MEIIMQYGAGHRTKVDAESIGSGIEKIVRYFMAETNEDINLKVLEIDGKILSDADRYKSMDIALWEYKGHEDEDFWEWNSKRLTDEMAVAIAFGL